MNCPQRIVSFLHTFFMVFFVLWQIPSYGEDVIVSVYVVDHKAFTEDHVNQITTVIDSALPNNVHLNISLDLEAMNPEEARAHVASSIYSNLKEGDIVTHLFVGTHGEAGLDADWSIIEDADLSDEAVSRMSNEEQAKLMEDFFSSVKSNSYLSVLGNFNADGPSPEFRQTFEHLSGKMADNAVVVFDSCNVFCGEPEVTAKKVSALAKFFKTNNGIFLGNIVEIWWADLLPRLARYRKSIRKNLGTISLSSIIMGILIGTGLNPEDSFQWSSFFLDSLAASIVGFAGTATLHGFIQDMKLWADGVKFRSRVFLQKEGRVESTIHLSTLGAAWDLIKSRKKTKKHKCNELLLPK